MIGRHVYRDLLDSDTVAVLYPDRLFDRRRIMIDPGRASEYSAGSSFRLHADLSTEGAEPKRRGYLRGGAEDHSAAPRKRDGDGKLVRVHVPQPCAVINPEHHLNWILAAIVDDRNFVRPREAKYGSNFTMSSPVADGVIGTGRQLELGFVEGVGSADAMDGHVLVAVAPKDGGDWFHRRHQTTRAT